MSSAIPLERLQKLLAMTSSDHVEEARTAALQACQLIRKHSLHVGPEAPSGRRVTVYADPPPPPWSSWRQLMNAHDELQQRYAAMQNQLRRLQHDVTEMQQRNGSLALEIEGLRDTETKLRAQLAAVSAAKAKAGHTKKKPAPPQPPPASGRDSNGGPIRLRTRYDSTCLKCHERIIIGDIIYWRREVGSTHDECADFWFDDGD